MKCTIFCFLALCAFQTVFADKVNENVDDLRLKASNEIYDVIDKLAKVVWDTADAVKIQGIESYPLVQTCWNTDMFRKYLKEDNATEDKCNQCYDEVKETDDSQSGKSCCDKLIGELKRKAQKDQENIIACIEKCVKLGSECKKMITYKDLPGIMDFIDKTDNTPESPPGNLDTDGSDKTRKI